MAGQLRLGSLTVEAAETAIAARVVAVGVRDHPPPAMIIAEDDEIVVFGPVVARRPVTESPIVRKTNLFAALA